MKKFAVFLLLLGTVLAYDAADYGCNKTGDNTICPQLWAVENVNGTFIDDIQCFSSANACTGKCGSIMDGGCYGYLALEKDMTIDVCKTKANSTDVEYGYDCTKALLSMDDMYVLFIDPSIIDYSDCQKFVNKTNLMADYLDTEAYLTICPVNEEYVTFDALASEDGFIVKKMEFTTPKTYAVTDLILENLIYIILIAATVIIGYYVLRPEGKKK